MNYQKIYDQIIDRAKQRKLEGYKEKHHIIPKCLGGSNRKENLVELTAREHFICHQLLCRIFPNEEKLLYALTSMAFLENKNQQRYLPSSRVIDQLKKESSEAKKGTCWVHKEGIQQKINKIDLETYLLRGFQQGRGVAYNKGKVSMVFDNKTYYIEESKVTYYINKGYTLGSANKGRKLTGPAPGKGRVCINDGTVTKRVYPQELDSFLNTGWKKGYHYKIDYATRSNHRIQKQ